MISSKYVKIAYLYYKIKAGYVPTHAKNATQRTNFMFVSFTDWQQSRL